MSIQKIKGLSLFANVGVAEAYLHQLGVDIKIANEIDYDRAKFYSEIYPHTKMIQGDITDVNLRKNIIREAKAEGVNFVMATPPCQGMSRVGKMDKNDIRNNLIYYAVEIIKELKPDYVLIENVTTILKTKITINGTEKLIPKYLEMELGNDYRFNKETKVKAMYYSIPQMRYRNIYLLVKKEKNITWEFPPHTQLINLKQAIGDLPSLDPELREGLEFTRKIFPEFDKKKRIASKISKWHRPPIHSWKLVECMMHTPTNESATKNDVYYPKKNNGVRVKAHYNQYRRLSWDKPCRCITQNNGVISSLACVHPGRPYYENGKLLYSDARVFTIYELLIISSLPSDWPIPNWANESFIRKVIGEGIPPQLIKVIMETLLKQI